MSAPAPALALAPARIDLREEFGWRRHRAGARAVWFKGHLAGADPVAALARAREPAAAAAVVERLDGHFAVVVEGPGWVLAAADRVGSIPLFYAETAAGHAVDGDARRLAARAGLDRTEPDAALSIAMAGYTVGRATLVPGLERLGAGELAILCAGAPPDRRRYYAYRPWRIRDLAPQTLRRQLAELSLGVLEKMVAGLDGRPVLVPLSAGLDSRLVAAGLCHLGYRHVRCFSYGLPGNHEAEAGRRIAARLGYPWRLVPYTPAQQRATFASVANRAFTAFADSLDAIPFQQDFHAVSSLAADGYAPPDAVFVNGQSGDYISGNHVPVGLFEPLAGADEEARWRRVLDALIAKHFSLWAHLRTPAAEARVRAHLRSALDEIGGTLGAPAHDYALYEGAEFGDRQAKYVIAGQRTYEFHGFDWRLPLWDRDFLDFWEAAPPAAKRGQVLYRRMLEVRNWGGVWGPGWRFRERVRPGWLVPVRLGLKALYAPLGRARWHAFERRRLAWLMDTTCNYAVAEYGRVARDKRGHRNAISWHAEVYLREKGIALDGLAETA